MNIESIIGIVAGVFGILTGVAWLHSEVKSRVKPRSSAVLFKELANKQITDAKKREILVKLNKTSVIKGRLSQEYIDGFEWNNRGIENLFLDLCEFNNIEPTDDICLDLLASRMPSLQKRYKDLKQVQIKVEEKNSPEVTEYDSIQLNHMKQTVYFSRYIMAYRCWNNITEALETNGVSFGLLPKTKDIWARDYMPAFSGGRYVAYKYNPDYLQKSREYITDNIYEVFDFSKDTIVKTDLVIDGGNIIVCGDKIIMTDKIFVENPNYTKEKVVELVEKAFSAKLVIIPWDKEEKYGHADRMVRYVSDNHVLINNYKDIDPELRLKILEALKPYFSQISELEYGSAQRVNSWAHINYLQVNDMIFVPQLDIPSDPLAIEQISKIFPGHKVIPVEVKGIVKIGGALNCVTWNHFES
ncbi:MAG: agmatine deiminase family protein [Muribaculaceae bacterium]